MPVHQGRDSSSGAVKRGMSSSTSSSAYQIFNDFRCGLKPRPLRSGQQRFKDDLMDERAGHEGAPLEFVAAKTSMSSRHLVSWGSTRPMPKPIPSSTADTAVGESTSRRALISQALALQPRRSRSAPMVTVCEAEHGESVLPSINRVSSTGLRRSLRGNLPPDSCGVPIPVAPLAPFPGVPPRRAEAGFPAPLALPPSVPHGGLAGAVPCFCPQLSPTLHRSQIPLALVARPTTTSVAAAVGSTSISRPPLGVRARSAPAPAGRQAQSDPQRSKWAPGPVPFASSMVFPTVLSSSPHCSLPGSAAAFDHPEEFPITAAAAHPAEWPRDSRASLPPRARAFPVPTGAGRVDPPLSSRWNGEDATPPCSPSLVSPLGSRKDSVWVKDWLVAKANELLDEASALDLGKGAGGLRKPRLSSSREGQPFRVVPPPALEFDPTPGLQALSQ
eukprot:RCo014857